MHARALRSRRAGDPETERLRQESFAQTEGEPETLREAKRCPEEHSDLMVRVASYSAPFTSLWQDLQEEIIARTEHAV